MRSQLGLVRRAGALGPRWRRRGSGNGVPGGTREGKSGQGGPTPTAQPPHHCIAGLGPLGTQAWGKTPVRARLATRAMQPDAEADIGSDSHSPSPPLDPRQKPSAPTGCCAARSCLKRHVDEARQEGGRIGYELAKGRGGRRQGRSDGEGRIVYCPPGRLGGGRGRRRQAISFKWLFGDGIRAEEGRCHSQRVVVVAASASDSCLSGGGDKQRWASSLPRIPTADVVDMYSVGTPQTPYGVCNSGKGRSGGPSSRFEMPQRGGRAGLIRSIPPPPPFAGGQHQHEASGANNAAARGECPAQAE